MTAKSGAHLSPLHLRVLIVEDEAVSRQMLQRLLELEGYHATISASGEEGLAFIRDTRPHIALIDLGLPDIDGHEVARRVRSDPNNQTTTLIALSGHGQATAIKASREAGFDAHLVKPLNVDELYRLLSEFGLQRPSGSHN